MVLDKESRYSCTRVCPYSLKLRKTVTMDGSSQLLHLEVPVSKVPALQMHSLPTRSLSVLQLRHLPVLSMPSQVLQLGLQTTLHTKSPQSKYPEMQGQVDPSYAL